MSLLETAKQYRDAGLSVIGSSKKGSVIKWKKYQVEKPNDEELEFMFIKKAFPMLAIVCGEASGNLEVIDVDTKNDLSGNLWQRLWDKILDYYKGEPPFAIVKTPSGGMHLYYRCSVIGRDEILAQREKRDDLDTKNTIIETRANGGLVMAPPTAGYVFLDDKIPFNIPTITEDERDDVLAICREFNEVFEEEKPIVTRTAKNYKYTPWDEYNDSDDWLQVLTEAGWQFSHKNETWDYYVRPGKEKEEGHSASWHRERRQFYVWSSNGGFQLKVGHRPFDIYKVIKCGGDFKKALAEIKAAGYGTHFSPTEETFISQAVGEFNNGLSFDDIKEMLSFDFDTAFRNQKDADIDILLTAAESRSMDANHIFWVEDEKSGKLSLDKDGFVEFLVKRGYRLFAENEYALNYRVVHMDFTHHWVQHVAFEHLRKNVKTWIETEGYQTYNVSRKKLNNLLIGIADSQLKTILDFLPRVHMDTLKFLKKAGDDKTQWFTFRNGAIKVTKEDIDIVKYDDLPNNYWMWRQDIKPFTFEKSDIETEEEFNESPIWLFFKRISGITKGIEHLDHQNELPVQHPELSRNFYAIITTVGYMLSAYKDPGFSVAPILEENTSTPDRGGGVGKGLLTKIIGTLRNVVHLDCKNWTPSKPFAWQDITLETDIIHFEDYEPTIFKFSAINNIITTGVPIENKWERTMKVPYEQSPKCVVSTNYKVSDKADFEARRQHKVYLYRYFTKTYKPEHELGNMIGPSWSEEDWQLCYNILFYCLQTYLAMGLIEAIPSADVQRRNLLIDYKEGFVDYMDNFTTMFVGKYCMNQEMFEDFISSGGNKRYWDQQRFNSAIHDYATRSGFKFFTTRNKKELIGERDKSYFILYGQDLELPPFTIENLKGSIF